jgi:hypothetical protein
VFGGHRGREKLEPPAFVGRNVCGGRSPGTCKKPYVDLDSILNLQRSKLYASGSRISN